MKNVFKQFMNRITESGRFLRRRITASRKKSATCGQNCSLDKRKIWARVLGMYAAFSIMLLLLPVSNSWADHIFLDNFDDVSDTALGSHTPDEGGSWAIIIQNGGGQLRVDVSASELDRLSGGNNDGVLYTANLIGGYPTADYEVSIDTNNGDTNDDWNYLALRIQDSSNMYVVQFNESGGQIYKQTTSGGWATLGAGFGGVSDGSTVTFRAVGSTLTVLDDGVVVRTSMQVRTMRSRWPATGRTALASYREAGPSPLTVRSDKP